MESINWSKLLGVLPALASISTAIIAYFALSTWRNQIRAQKQMEFMDQLIGTVHEYMQSMAAPIQYLSFVKIGIKSYSEVASLEGKDTVEGIITYINTNGNNDHNKLLEYLDKVRTINSRVYSLLSRATYSISIITIDVMRRVRCYRGHSIKLKRLPYWLEVRV
jgi:type II secretory pathway pseudopilin PulG